MHRRVNPIAPIPRGFGVMAVNPVSGKQVHFDDCFRYAGDLVDGDMQMGDFAEAKGPRYAVLLRFGGKPRESIINQPTDQANRQNQTAEQLGVHVKWYFAEPYAAEEIRRVFKNDYPSIYIGTMPPSTPSRKHR